MQIDKKITIFKNAHIYILRVMKSQLINSKNVFENVKLNKTQTRTRFKLQTSVILLE